MKLINRLLLCLLVILTINCATSTAGITTSNIPIVSKKYRVIEQVDEVEKWITIDFGIFGFPLTKPPIDELINKVLKEKDADALINIRYWNDKIIILFITVNRFGFTAEAIKFE